MEKTAKDEDRFWSKVVHAEESNPCWVWTGTRLKSGYGTFKAGSLRDGTRRNVLAHRFVCEISFTDQLFDGWQALHKCDVKWCVNPAHLYVGTHEQNMRDAKERHRMKATVRPGEHNPNAKLTLAQAVAIKQSSERNSVLAKQFGITRTHVAYIKAGKCWGGAVAA